jgi:hypothetical protein
MSDIMEAHGTSGTSFVVMRRTCASLDSGIQTSRLHVINFGDASARVRLGSPDTDVPMTWEQLGEAFARSTQPSFEPDEQRRA